MLPLNSPNMIDEHSGTWAPIKIKFACENYLVSIRVGVFSGIGLPTAKKKKPSNGRHIFKARGGSRLAGSGVPN